MALISEEDYDQLHTDDGIVDIEGQCVTNWIVTKICSMQNIITTLHGTDILEAVVITIK
jgi:hypothetical protein